MFAKIAGTVSNFAKPNEFNRLTLISYQKIKCSISRVRLF